VAFAQRSLAGLMGLVGLAAGRSPKQARRAAGAVALMFQQAQADDLRLEAAYGAAGRKMVDRLAEHLAERGSLGFAHEQAVPLLPLKLVCLPEARTILLDGEGSSSSEELGRRIYLHLQRRAASVDEADPELQQLFLTRVGEEQSYKGIADELWEMWHEHSSQ